MMETLAFNELMIWKYKTLFLAIDATILKFAVLKTLTKLQVNILQFV